MREVIKLAFVCCFLRQQESNPEMVYLGSLTNQDLLKAWTEDKCVPLVSYYIWPHVFLFARVDAGWRQDRVTSSHLALPEKNVIVSDESKANIAHVAVICVLRWEIINYLTLKSLTKKHQSAPSLSSCNKKPYFCVCSFFRTQHPFLFKSNPLVFSLWR